MRIDSFRPGQLPPGQASGFASGASQGAAEPGRTAGTAPGDLIDLNGAGLGTVPNLTVVVPTRNEEHNVEVLLERLGPAIAPLGAELDRRRRQRRPDPR